MSWTFLNPDVSLQVAVVGSTLQYGAAMKAIIDYVSEQLRVSATGMPPEKIQALASILTAEVTAEVAAEVAAETAAEAIRDSLTAPRKV